MIFQKQRFAIVLVLFLQSFIGFAQISTSGLGGQSSQGVSESSAGSSTANGSVTEQEIKQNLLLKGIDLDNLRPEQLATIDADIQQAIIELQTNNSSQTDAGIFTENKSKEFTTTSDNSQDSLSGIKKEKEVIKEEPTEEELLQKEMKKRLNDSKDLFGFNIFFNNSVGYYEKVNSNSVPNTYVLDAGDKLAINIFGRSQADLLYEIEDDGFIRPTGMYKIYLQGVSFGQAKELLRKRFAQIYRFQDDQFNVSLNTARTINVNIFGEVYSPGSYSVSALNNVINAIIVAGGPMNTADIREIRVVSNGKERFIDIYDYVTNPVASSNLKIFDGDLIFIDRSKKRVSTKGDAFRGLPLKYELKQDEHLNELIKYLGGVRNTMALDYIQLETIEGEQRVLRDYSYNDAIKANLKLQDGDQIELTSHFVKTENFFKVRGTIRKPGRYELIEGFKVSDVLDLVVLEDETFSEVAYLTRTKDDGTFQLIKLDIKGILAGDSSENIAIVSRDELVFYNKNSFTDEYQVSVSGAVREAGSYRVNKGKTFTIYDLLMMSKGLQEFATDFGYIASVDMENKNNTNYTIVNLKKAFLEPESSENLTFKPGDKLVVPSQHDYTDDFEIQISGAVRKPGTYKYNSTLSLKEVIVMSGGLKLEAASNRIDIYRLQINENEPTVTLSESYTVDRNIEPLNLGSDLQLQPFDHIVVRSAPEFEEIQYVTIKGEVRYPGVYALISDNERLSDIVERADGLTTEAFPEAGKVERTINQQTGVVVTRLDKAIKENKRHNLVVKGGDVITIPKVVDVVSIDRVGTNTVTEMEIRTGKIDSSESQLNVQINFRRKRAKWYINKYGGGFSKEAKRSATKVLYPNGQVKRTLNLGIVKIYPKVRRGSEIVLDLKEKAKNKGEEGGASNALARRERVDRLIDSTTALLGLITTAITTIILSQRL